MIDQTFIDALNLPDIKRVTPVSGGDVNDAYKMSAADRDYFLLVQPNNTKDFFVPEAAGLKDFERAGVTAPEVIDLGEIGSDAYMIISYLEEGRQRNYPALAKLVAKLHRYESESGLFGYDYPHRGAKMTYDNAWTASWTELYIERRLDRLRDELVEMGHLNHQQVERYEKARELMTDELENRQIRPSLLHGDLWGGNHMFLKDGQPAIFDPAPFYGDREFDLGVATSFGAYPREFFKAYHKAYPLNSGFEWRLAFYRLYVYMNHLHKFGSIYAGRVEQTLDEILYH